MLYSDIRHKHVVLFRIMATNRGESKKNCNNCVEILIFMFNYRDKPSKTMAERDIHNGLIFNKFINMACI